MYTKKRHIADFIWLIFFFKFIRVDERRWRRLCPYVISHFLDFIPSLRLFHSKQLMSYYDICTEKWKFMMTTMILDYSEQLLGNLHFWQSSQVQK